jgi:hypothetical protein
VTSGEADSKIGKENSKRYVYKTDGYPIDDLWSDGGSDGDNDGDNDAA